MTLGKASITIAIDGKWNGKDAVTAAVSDLGRLSKGTTASAKAMASYMDAQESSAQRLSRLVASTSKSNSAALAQSGSDMVEAAGSLYQIGDAAQSVGKSLTASITTPLMAAASTAGAAAVEFDTALANLRKTSDLTASELDSLAQSAIELSKTQPVDASTILNIEALGSQLGVANENLESFANTVSGLDIATDMDADTAATEMARFANIVGMAEENFSNYGSTIVAIGNNMATTESEVSNMAQRFASAGHQANLSEAEILGFSAAMSALGMRAEAGGSALSQVFTKISTAVSSGGEKMDAFAKAAGLSASQFASAWKSSASDAFTALLQGIHDSSEAGADMNVTLSELGITQIRTSDVMRRMAGSVGEVTDALALSRTAWEENTALQKEVDQRNESMASRLEVLRNKAEAIAIEVGGPLVEAVISAADALDPLVSSVSATAEAFSEADEGTQRLVLGIAAVAAGAGPALDAMGGVTKAVSEVMASFGHFEQDVAVYKDALTTVDGAQMRAYASANTLASRTGLAGNAAAVAAEGVDRYVSTWEKWYDASKQVDSKTEKLAAVVNKLSTAQEGGGKAAEKMAAKLVVQRNELERQVSTATVARDENKALLDKWTAAAGAADAMSSSAATAAGSISNLGAGMRLAGAQALAMVADFAKMAAVSAVVTGIVAVVGKAIERYAEWRQRQDDLAAASETLCDIQERVAATAESQAKSVSDVADACEDSLQKVIELNEGFADSISDVEVGSRTLDEYLSVIDELTERESLNAVEQERLKLAVEGYNEVTGESVSVTDSASGQISESTSELHRNADAWRANAEAQAYQQVASEYMKARVEATVNLEKAQTNLSAAQERLDELQRKHNEHLQGGAALTREEADEMRRLAAEDIPAMEEAVESATTAVDSASESYEYAVKQMSLLGEEAQRASDAYARFATSTAGASLEEAGVDVAELSDRLRTLGADTDALASLTEEQVAAVASAYDGSTDSVIAALAEQGVSMQRTLDEAAAMSSGIQEKLSTLARGAGTSLGELGYDAGELSNRLRDAGVESSDMASLTAREFARMASECGGDVDRLVSKIRDWNAQQMASKTASVSVDTSAIDRAANKWNNTSFATRYANIQVRASGGNNQVALMAAGGVRVMRHAAGTILTRPTVLDTLHVAGEAGAEAVIPLTNRRYVLPFARTVAQEAAPYLKAATTQVSNTYNVTIDGRSLRSDPSLERLVRGVVEIAAGGSDY